MCSSFFAVSLKGSLVSTRLLALFERRSFCLEAGSLKHEFVCALREVVFIKVSLKVVWMENDPSPSCLTSMVAYDFSLRSASSCTVFEPERFSSQKCLDIFVLHFPVRTRPWRTVRIVL
jgi:hypothetical protein